jgi:hypothetical protein
MNLSEQEVSTSKGYQDFLSELLAIESGIRPELHNWYVENWDKPVLRYPKVTKPGRAVRDTFSGKVIHTPTTVREYFERLGVVSLFDPSDRACLIEMQYRSTNALGFIGYQIGEKILAAQGYYVPAEVMAPIDGQLRRLPRFYAAALADRHWIAGRTTAIIQGDTGERVVSTDVNEWAGHFTGKAGLHSLNDLMRPYHQDRLMDELLHESCRALRAGWYDAPVIPETSEQMRFAHRKKSIVSQSYTLSGLLAAAHLCGTKGVFQFLSTGTEPQDEFGTSMLHYLDYFSGYALPFEELQ